VLVVFVVAVIAAAIRFQSHTNGSRASLGWPRRAFTLPDVAAYVDKSPLSFRGDKAMADS